MAEDGHNEPLSENPVNRLAVLPFEPSSQPSRSKLKFQTF
jgi:hypothetical protein